MNKKTSIIILTLVIPLAVFGLILVVNVELCNPWFIEGVDVPPGAVEVSDNVSPVCPPPYPSAEGLTDNITSQPVPDNAPSTTGPDKPSRSPFYRSPST
jgi:hypothetical protein